MSLLFEIMIFSLLPASMMLLGAGISIIKEPSIKVKSMAQHFAAGVVFAAVAVEILPLVQQAEKPFATGIGFILGVATLLTIKIFAPHDHVHEEDNKPLKSPTTIHQKSGLIFAFSVDLLIDGLLLGLAFSSSEKGGVLIAIALAFEIFFLGVSLAVTLINGVSILKILSVALGLSFVFILGAWLGRFCSEVLTGDALTGLLAFGLAALLYLVTEELLLEAHTDKDTPFETAAFFIGFLLIILL